MNKLSRRNPTKPATVPPVLGVGMTLAVVVALFAYGGLWLDDRLGTTPLFVLLGVLLGIVGGLIHLLRVLAPELLPFGRRPKKPDPPPTAPSG